ncbi:branched-chain amino acid ABC transporter permease [Hwanghaeella grinnelliae]|uniref:Branched-chain amino acid ABC transporter permease n=1 Tax=Hwanghaeella grinnelliae TaxID=2500179 RepID=A0A3S2WSA3_9PROT|nr:branched-chain amino acid ABC transporter permease [Hwanghaeella grinnelliae]
MSDVTLNHAEWRAARRVGLIDGFGVPSFALFTTMIGFGAIAREAGLDIYVTVATTMFVWGMPGQVAFADLYAAGASGLVIFTAVALANMRMLPMTVSGLPMMHLKAHKRGLFRNIVTAHLLAITGWAQLTAARNKVPPMGVLPYYLGFVSVVYVAANLGTVFGYYLSDIVPDPVIRVAVYVTPLYIVLLVSSARVWANRLAVLLGAILGPLTYPLLGDWCILAAGLGGGTVAVVIAHKTGRAPE